MNMLKLVLMTTLTFMQAAGMNNDILEDQLRTAHGLQPQANYAARGTETVDKGLKRFKSRLDYYANRAEGSTEKMAVLILSQADEVFNYLTPQAIEKLLFAVSPSWGNLERYFTARANPAEEKNSSRKKRYTFNDQAHPFQGKQARYNQAAREKNHTIDHDWLQSIVRLGLPQASAALIPQDATLAYFLSSEFTQMQLRLFFKSLGTDELKKDFVENTLFNHNMLYAWEKEFPLLKELPELQDRVTKCQGWLKEALMSMSTYFKDHAETEKGEVDIMKDYFKALPETEKEQKYFGFRMLLSAVDGSPLISQALENDPSRVSNLKKALLIELNKLDDSLKVRPLEGLAVSVALDF